MDEMYLRDAIKNQVERLMLLAVGGCICGGYLLLDTYTTWSPWWALLSILPLFIISSVVGGTLQEVIFRRKGFPDRPAYLMVGVTDGRIGERARLINRFKYLVLVLAFPLLVTAFVLSKVGGLEGTTLVYIPAYLGVGLLILEPWWLEPFQRSFLKRRNLHNLYTEKDVEDAPG